MAIFLRYFILNNINAQNILYYDQSNQLYLKLSEISKILSLKVTNSVKFLLEIFSLGDTESHLIKLQMTCTKIYLHKSKALSFWYRFNLRINIQSLYLLFYRRLSYPRWGSPHISIIGN